MQTLKGTWLSATSAAPAAALCAVAYEAAAAAASARAALVAAAAALTASPGAAAATAASARAALAAAAAADTVAPGAARAAAYRSVRARASTAVLYGTTPAVPPTCGDAQPYMAVVLLYCAAGLPASPVVAWGTEPTWAEGAGGSAGALPGAGCALCPAAVCQAPCRGSHTRPGTGLMPCAGWAAGGGTAGAAKLGAVGGCSSSGRCSSCRSQNLSRDSARNCWFSSLSLRVGK